VERARRAVADVPHAGLGGVRRGDDPGGRGDVDGSGRVVAEGRNRIYERAAPAGEVANSLLAHAEVNALVRLDPEHRYEDHVLYTALEPCLLCVGAAVMATVGRVRYAGADPYGGGDGGLIGVNPHVERVPLRLEGPRRDPFGAFATALHVAFFLRLWPSLSRAAGGDAAGGIEPADRSPTR
jgi:tRNA(adenine34) deaminase